MAVKTSPLMMTKKGGFSSPKFSLKQPKSIATKGNVVRNTNVASKNRNTSTVK